jgi:6,7-dimethyl-8-ribityllumazine synthase
MPNVIEGELTLPEGRFAIAASRFNSLVVEALMAGALDAFRRQGISEDRIDLVRVPGAFELPSVAMALGHTTKYSAVVCLGCIIKGDTDHYDHVAGAASSGLAAATVDAGVPVIFGVLTCETLEQALHRAGGKAGNKGAEAALAAIEMASLMRKIG